MLFPKFFLLAAFALSSRFAHAGESLWAEDLKRKTELCGAESIEKDTVGNFSKTPTPWFAGSSKVLFDAHESFIARILLLQKAKISIDLSTYIFDADESTRAVIDELRKAVRRGVNVRLMLDAGGSVMEFAIDHFSHLRSLKLAQEQAQIAYDKHLTQVKPGQVDIVVFHPLLNMPTIISQINDRFLRHLPLIEETSMNWNRRSHDKILIIDKENPLDTYAIVGGRNMADRYFGVPKIDEFTYEDIEILMKNPQAEATHLGNTLGQHYQNLFCSKGNYWISPNFFDGGNHYKNQIDNGLKRLLHNSHLAKLYAEMKGSSGFDYLNQNFTPSRLHSANEIENLKHKTSVVMIDPNKEAIDTLENGDSIFREVQRMTAQAKKSIDICTPYIFLSRNERDCLKKWVSEAPGRTLRLMSNSAATTDNIFTMTSFEKTTAPELMASKSYECHYLEIIGDKKVERIARGTFDNRDHRIEVFELGRLDNKLFKNEWYEGKRAPANEIYGKLHAKFGIIDGQFSFVGSDNLDPRSRNLNSETTFFIESNKIANDLTKIFESFIGRSYRFDDPKLQTMKGLKAIRQKIFEIEMVDKVFKSLPLLESAI
jgi:putative cardiolipin synthase